MISNEGQLAEALRKFAGYELALEKLQEELLESNPALFGAAVPAYLAKMRVIRLDIEAWLGRYAL